VRLDGSLKVRGPPHAATPHTISSSDIHPKMNTFSSLPSTFSFLVIFSNHPQRFPLDSAFRTLTKQRSPPRASTPGYTLCEFSFSADAKAAICRFFPRGYHRNCGHGNSSSFFTSSSVSSCSSGMLIFLIFCSIH